MSRIINDDNPTKGFELEDTPILPETLKMPSTPQVQVTQPRLESLRASIASMSAERFRMLFGIIGSPTDPPPLHFESLQELPSPPPNAILGEISVLSL
jgi:hypothetical protein